MAIINQCTNAIISALGKKRCGDTGGTITDNASINIIYAVNYSSIIRVLYTSIRAIRTGNSTYITSSIYRPCVIGVNNASIICSCNTAGIIPTRDFCCIISFTDTGTSTVIARNTAYISIAFTVITSHCTGSISLFNNPSRQINSILRGVSILRPRNSANITISYYRA